MTHWMLQQLHLSDVLLSFYLLVKQQLEEVESNHIFFGTFFAKIAIIGTTQGKE